MYNFFLIFFFRRCKYPDICGDKVLRQRAYCFPRISGSFCERWFNEHNRHNELAHGHGHRSGDRAAIQSNSVLPPVKGATKRSPEYAAQDFKCGFPLGKRNATKSMLSMLKIIGGRSARRTKWPWQVAVLNRYKVPCVQRIQRNFTRSNLHLQPRDQDTYIFLLPNDIF